MASNTSVKVLKQIIKRILAIDSTRTSRGGFDNYILVTVAYLLYEKVTFN